MAKLGNYITGSWVEGQGNGVALYDSVTGDVVATATADGLDFAEVLAYGRRTGSRALRKMTFQERGRMLKKLAMYLLKNKKKYYEISYQTGATKTDSWIDIEGGIGNLFANASLRKEFSNQIFHVEGNPIDLSRGGDFMGHHILVPKRGVAIHINAFNFPIWGMLEKVAVNWMAGVAAVVKPATATSYLTEAIVRDIIESGILPEGSLQLICGSARNILDAVDSQDVVTFTGSAATGKLLKSHPRLIEEAVPFNMEADSLNCCVLGEDAVPGTPEFDLFIKEVRKEMTVKSGQKCTAIRRTIVPANLVEDVRIALGKQLSRVSIGNPRHEKVRMGALASRDQVTEVRERVQELLSSCELVYGDLENVELVDADAGKGAFLSPIVLLEKDPFGKTGAHDIEAFGPVTTIMPYNGVEEAAELARMGKGSLVGSFVSNDNELAREFVVESASHHGRILVLNRESARQSTGHGSPLPTLTHGGPGRAGGGEEMGGMRGVKHYMQRCAVQASPTTMTAITGIYQAGSAVVEAEQHPFAYHYEDIQPGMSITTHRRTVTDSDIINFANLTWDHFYAHTDITSLQGSIFEKRAAHGYFILAAAAGLFVHPHKGPVGANYGFEDCRFIRPIYHNDTIYARLTCKEKVDRDSRGKEHPSGVVKWFVEVFDQDGELAAFATILTLVQKKAPFADIDRKYLEQKISELREDAQPQWGMMTAQHMVEHLEQWMQIGLRKMEAPLYTPEEQVEKYQDSLYNYRSMPKEFSHPHLKKGELEELRYESMADARKAFFATYDELQQFFKENPEGTAFNPVFGELNAYEWYLCERKHIHHHFGQFGLIPSSRKEVPAKS